MVEVADIAVVEAVVVVVFESIYHLTGLIHPLACLIEDEQIL